MWSVDEVLVGAHGSRCVCTACALCVYAHSTTGVSFLLLSSSVSSLPPFLLLPFFLIRDPERLKSLESSHPWKCASGSVAPWSVPTERAPPLGEHSLGACHPLEVCHPRRVPPRSVPPGSVPPGSVPPGCVPHRSVPPWTIYTPSSGGNMYFSI